MQRLVKDALGLQKEAEKNEQNAKIKEREEDKDYNISFVKKFFRQYDYLSQYFSDEEILAACKRHMSKDRIAREEICRGTWTKDTSWGNYVKNVVTYFEERRGEWTRKVKDNGTVFLVANSYQNIYGATDVTKDLLLQKCPYLSEYSMGIYDVSSRNDWIYIDIPKKADGYASRSLYAPFSALIQKDASKITETHKKYWHNYGNGKYDKETEELLESKFVKDFLEKVAKGE